MYILERRVTSKKIQIHFEQIRNKKVLALHLSAQQPQTSITRRNFICALPPRFSPLTQHTHV
jgi:hypothetical protein